MLKTALKRMFKRTVQIILLCITLPAIAEDNQTYRVIDSNYSVCQTLDQYKQLLRWSLYGVGTPPQTGCLPAPANAKAIIKQCQESDIIICQFELTPEDGGPILNVWASKVILKPVTP